MFMPSRCIRNCFLVITLATLAGCADEGSLLGPDAPASFARGGNGGGNGGGGNNGSGEDPIVEEFDVWDPTAWIAGDHPLGRGWLDPANVSHENATLLLALPAGTYDGAEIRSASRVRFRNVEVRLRSPSAPGSISCTSSLRAATTRSTSRS